MHTRDSERWQHDHVFAQDRVRPGEMRTLIVVGITATMMVVEIAAGLVYGSMALLADGLHMASHAAALGIAFLAYVIARRLAADDAAGGFILDGFPRNIAQAEALDALLDRLGQPVDEDRVVAAPGDVHAPHFALPLAEAALAGEMLQEAVGSVGLVVQEGQEQVLGSGGLVIARLRLVACPDHGLLRPEREGVEIHPVPFAYQ